jgi:hypothetical protein
LTEQQGTKTILLYYFLIWRLPNMEYELISEIINPCAGDKRPEIVMDEIETDDTDAYVQGLWGACFEKSVSASGSIIYEQNTDGLTRRLTLTGI